MFVSVSFGSEQLDDGWLAIRPRERRIAAQGQLTLRCQDCPDT